MRERDTKLPTMRLAVSHRKDADERVANSDDAQRDMALNAIEAEIRSLKMQAFVQSFEIPANSLTGKINRVVKDAVVKRHSAIWW